MSGLSPGSKKLVREMSSAQAAPCAIFAAIKEKHSEDCPTQRHIYNYREKIRTESFEGRDVIGQFYRLAIDKEYVHWTQAVPGSNVMPHLFMAHPTSITLFRSYYLFVGMDSTYKTNKYKMSFFEIIGMTPSNKNFLIAYAIMKDETKESYMWEVIHRVQGLIVPFITGFHDVVADGNYGFRVLVDAITYKQKEWKLMRVLIENEMRANRDLYAPVYGNGFDAALTCIKWAGAGCSESHWMVSPDDLYVAASVLNAVIFLFTTSQLGCCTILPMRSDDGRPPEREIVICHLGSYHHYIRLYLHPTFLVPPIATQRRIFHDPSVRHLDNLYAERRETWTRLY
ncbi:uncharacterized protein [Euphorbia lathyris]|uniref:uncharacterized protein n=1 Tax=Euphorbia lathyris TaxID=212925 RepID=UPI00331333F4